MNPLSQSSLIKLIDDFPGGLFPRYVCGSNALQQYSLFFDILGQKTSIITVLNWQDDCVSHEAVTKLEQ